MVYQRKVVSLNPSCYSREIVSLIMLTSILRFLSLMSKVPIRSAYIGCKTSLFDSLLKRIEKFLLAVITSVSICIVAILKCQCQNSAFVLQSKYPNNCNVFHFS